MKQHPDCSLCADRGIVGGTSEMEFRWCQCRIGVLRSMQEPNVVDDANRNLERLKERFVK